MKKQLIAASIILAIATTPVMAAPLNESQQQTTELESDGSSEIIGFSTGAIIGGIIAGPLGIVTAGTIGLIIGQSYERQEQVELAEVRLKNNSDVMQSLNNETENLKSQLQETEQNQQQLSQQLALTENTLNQVKELEKVKLNLRFEIDSSKVESFYAPQIKHLAMMMQENPNLSVNLSGFADPSGSKESNLTLSKARTESVKSMLVNLGVDETHISTQAFGESQSVQSARTASTDFNNRRVEVELVSPKETVAQTALITPKNIVAQELGDDEAQIVADIH